jgi:hypothetical protein
MVGEIMDWNETFLVVETLSFHATVYPGEFGLL